MRALLGVATLAAAIVFIGSTVRAQGSQPATGATTDSAAVRPTPAATPPPAPKQSSTQNRVYYGGSVSLAFSGAFRIGIYPMIGYKLSPKASLGAEVGYEYVNYDNTDKSASNYGGSVFARYRVVPQAYGMAKFQAVSYEFFGITGDSSRETVPFLLLGGGVVQRVAPRTTAYAEVLFDVLQDESSPYESWEPFVNVGVGVGF